MIKYTGQTGNTGHVGGLPQYTQFITVDEIKYIIVHN